MSTVKVTALLGIMVFAWLSQDLRSSGSMATPCQDGIYTETQAARGEKLYDRHCSGCHGYTLRAAGIPPLAGDEFLKTWARGKHTLDDLFYIVRTQMPYGAGGTLSKQEYIDVVAYILQRNGYPAGEKELPVDASVLRKIKISTQITTGEK